MKGPQKKEYLFKVEYLAISLKQIHCYNFILIVFKGCEIVDVAKINNGIFAFWDFILRPEKKILISHSFILMNVFLLAFFKTETNFLKFRQINVFDNQAINKIANHFFFTKFNNFQNLCVRIGLNLLIKKSINHVL